MPHHPHSGKALKRTPLTVVTGSGKFPDVGWKLPILGKSSRGRAVFIDVVMVRAPNQGWIAYEWRSGRKLTALSTLRTMGGRVPSLDLALHNAVRLGEPLVGRIVDAAMQVEWVNGSGADVCSPQRSLPARLDFRDTPPSVG